MTRCDGCGEEVGNLFCGKCRQKVEASLANLSKQKMLPLLYYDTETRLYHAGCTVVKCPCNRDGVCKTGHLFLSLMKTLFHEFDGDNCVQQACG